MSDLPPEDEVTAGWWEGTRRRELLIQRCRDCGYHQHYPRPLCTRCTGTELDLVPASGRGTLVSFTVVARPPSPTRPAGYTVGLVALEEGPVLITNIVTADLQPPPVGSLRCGQELVAAFVPLGDDRALPVFQPAATT